MNIEHVQNNYRSNSHFLFNCKYHVIFCPKFRRPVLTEDISKRLKEILIEISNKYNSLIIEIEILLDHIHMIIDCDPSFGITKVIREMKGNSSRILRSEFPDLRTKLPSMWTRSSFISSVGTVSLEVVKQYIQDQKGK